MMKQAKVGLSIALLLAVVLSFSACKEEETAVASGQSLYDKGLAVVSMMDEMAQESCARLFTTDEETLAVVQTAEQGDYSAPQAVYKVTVSQEGLEALVETGGLTGLSDQLQNYTKQRALGSVANIINGESGAVQVAAASICTVGQTFVSQEAAEDAIYIYTYENAVPAAVTFLSGEDGAVTATGCFIFNDSFTYGSAQEIQTRLGQMLQGVQVTEVTAPSAQ